MPNSLLVSGITNTEADEELYDVLNHYGSTQRKITIGPSRSELGPQIIIEFTYGTAVCVTVIHVVIKVNMSYKYSSF